MEGGLSGLPAPSAAPTALVRLLVATAVTRALERATVAEARSRPYGGGDLIVCKPKLLKDAAAKQLAASLALNP
jgi:hypothetical protein